MTHEQLSILHRMYYESTICRIWYFVHRMPLGKGWAVAFNLVCRSKVKAKAELYKKKNPCQAIYRAYLFSLSSITNMAHASLTESLLSKNVQFHYMKSVVKGQSSIGSWKKSKHIHVYLLLSHICLMFHLNISLEYRVCSDLEPSFKVNCKGHRRIIWKSLVGSITSLL